MKLIDADKLKNHLWDRYCHYACNGSDLNKAAALNVGLGAIEVQEEIEAIPISWIEEYNKNNIDDEFISLKGLLHKMIIDWREENED